MCLTKHVRKYGVNIRSTRRVLLNRAKNDSFFLVKKNWFRPGFEILALRHQSLFSFVFLLLLLIVFHFYSTIQLAKKWPEIAKSG